MVILILILIIVIARLLFDVMSKERGYLTDTNSYKLKLKNKEKELETLRKELDYYKNLGKYEEYLKD